MAKKFTPLKEVLETHDTLVTEWKRDTIQRQINEAVHQGCDSVRVDTDIDDDMKKELKAAGYTYNRSKKLVSW